MFFQPQTSHIGLDIGDRSLKAIQLKKTIKGKLIINAVSSISMPEGIFDDGNIKQPDKFIEAVKQLLSHPSFGRFITNNVVACLPETKTFIMMIDVPPMSEEEKPQAIKWEAEHHIPVPIDETYWDWQTMPNTTSSSHTPILLGVVPKDISNSYSDALLSAKLTPLALEIEAISIVRSLIGPKLAQSDTATMIVDIGGTRTSLIVFDKGTIQFTVSLPISGRRITQTIAETLNISEAEAEQAKKVCGFDKDKCEGAITNILQPIINELVNRVQESQIFYRDHFPNGSKITQVILCGGGANFKKISEIFSQALSLPITLGDPTVNLDKNNIPIPTEAVVSYTTAIGLALKESF